MIKLFTHTDLDGIGCAILAQLVFGKENINISYCGYDSIDNKVKEFISKDEFEKCFITDISISDELAKEIDERFDNIYLLDHHPTAIDLNKYEWCNVKIEENGIKTCGTELFYNYLVDNDILYPSILSLDAIININKFVDTVRDYDTWRWESLGDEGIISKKLNDLFKIYGKEEFIEWAIKKITHSSYSSYFLLDDADNIILNIKQKEINNYIKTKNNEMYITFLCEKKCGVVFADQYTSELGNTLCKLNPDLDFVAIINIGIGVVSFRTIKDDIDLGKDIAQKFGGGGHPKSAAMHFIADIKNELITRIFTGGNI